MAKKRRTPARKRAVKNPPAETQASATPPPPGLKMPRLLKAAPIGFPSTEVANATLAAVRSTPAQTLITAKTGRQIAGPVLGPGSRVALRVVRY